MLRRDVLVPHLLRLALGGLEDLHELRRRLGLGTAGDLGKVAQLRLDDALQLPAIGADLVQHRADHASLSASMAARRCSGSTCGFPRSVARFTARSTASRP